MQFWNETECIGTMGEAYQYLSSSHILYTGCWINRNVWFNHLDTGTGNHKVQAKVPILVVTRKITCPGYRIGVDGFNCPSPLVVITNPDPPRMIGIGFGRTADGQPEGTPDKNPLLNVVAIRDVAVDLSSGYSTYHPGYIISKEGLQVGLTATNYDSASFGSREAALPLSVSTCVGSSTPIHLCQRNELPGCLSIDNVPSPCLPISVLLDTGLNQSYIRVPSSITYSTHDDPSDNSTTSVLDNGQHVHVELGVPQRASEDYTTGFASPVLPARVYNYHDDARAPFVNTGRHVYKAWKTAFDPVCGNLAFASA